MFKKIWYNPIHRRIFLITSFLFYAFITFTIIPLVNHTTVTGILGVGFVAALILLALLMPGNSQQFLINYARKCTEEGNYEESILCYEKLLSTTKKPLSNLDIAIYQTCIAHCFRLQSKKNNDPAALEKTISLCEEYLPAFYDYAEDYTGFLRLLSDDYWNLAQFKDKDGNMEKSITCLSKVSDYLNSISGFNIIDSYMIDIENNINKADKLLQWKEGNYSEDSPLNPREVLFHALHQGNLLLDKLHAEEDKPFKAFVLKSMADINYRLYEITNEQEYADKALNGLKESLSLLGTTPQVLRYYKNAYIELIKKISTIENKLYPTFSKSGTIRCISCNSNFESEDFYPVCKKCQKQIFSIPPMPIPVKIVLVAVLAVVVYAFIQFPSAMKAGISYEKGVKAEKSNHFYTASKEYTKALNAFPDSLLIQSRLFISYVEEGKPEHATKAYDMLAERGYSNNKLYKEVSKALDKVKSVYNIDKDLEKILKEYSNLDFKNRLNKLNSYVKSHPSDAIAQLYLGNEFFDMKQYPKALEHYQKAVTINPNFYDTKLYVAAVYRQQNNYDKAIALCNEVLDKNCEYAPAFVSLSKIELKRKNYKKGLELAQKAYEYDSEYSFIQGALVLAYHFNKMIAERDQMFAKLQKTDKPYAEEIKAIIDGKKSYFE